MIDEASRALLIDNLTSGPPYLSLPKALASALGIRQSGRAWLEAKRDLDVLRREDAEVRVACEAAERRAKEARDDRAEQGTEAASNENREHSSGISDGTRGAREADGGDPGHGPDVHPAGEVTDRDHLPAPSQADSGGGHGDLSAGGSGRETREEALEGEGATEGEPGTSVVQRDVSDARLPVTMLDVVRAGLPHVAANQTEHSNTEILTDYSDDFERVMAEARDKYGPGRIGQLKWINERGQMMRPALHAIEPLWLDAFSDYYDSGKLIMLARKGLRAGGSSSACPALVRCTTFADRTLDAGTIGVVPIMSATRDEADGRFVTIRSYLRAIGFKPPKKKGASDDDGDEDGVTYEVAPGGITGEFRTRRSTSGGGVIAMQDRFGHRVQFRILPALVKHGVGYTGIAGFADESDLWPNDPEHHVNPAEKILDRISERFTTTYPGAEMLIFSASYNADSAHKRAVDAAAKPGTDDPLTHLVRLGKEGARRDEQARWGLLRETNSDDPRLLAPGDPMSPDLPAWVFNPNDADIGKCFKFSKGDLSRMLGLYGGRAAEHAAEHAGGGLAWCEGLAARNAALNDSARYRNERKAIGTVRDRNIMKRKIV